MNLEISFKFVTIKGIHTKIAQVCAYELGIEMASISVKYAENMTNPNSQSTGGSVTSELVAQVREIFDVDYWLDDVSLIY